VGERTKGPGKDISAHNAYHDSPTLTEDVNKGPEPYRECVRTPQNGDSYLVNAEEGYSSMTSKPARLTPNRWSVVPRAVGGSGARILERR
jgi:hypothetical protein